MLITGVVVFLICVMAALMLGFQQYVTIGEFFQLPDIMDHEAGMITFLAFGSGVLLAATGFNTLPSRPNRARHSISDGRPSSLPDRIQLDHATMASADNTARSKVLSGNRIT